MRAVGRIVPFPIRSWGYTRHIPYLGRGLAPGWGMSGKARWKPLKNGTTTKRHAAFLTAKALDRAERDKGSISPWQALWLFCTDKERERFPVCR